MELPNGKYRGKAASWALGETSTGKEQVGIEFDLLDFPGNRITYYGYFSEAAIASCVKALRTCGWQGNDLTDLSGLDANDVELVIENETYEGRVSPRVRWVNPAGGLAMRATMSADRAKAFAAQMRGRIAAADAMAARPAAKTTPRQAAKPTNGSTRPAAAAADDLDIPF